VASALLAVPSPAPAAAASPGAAIGAAIGRRIGDMFSGFGFSIDTASFELDHPVPMPRPQTLFKLNAFLSKFVLSVAFTSKFCVQVKSQFETSPFRVQFRDQTIRTPMHTQQPQLWDVTAHAQHSSHSCGTTPRMHTQQPQLWDITAHAHHSTHSHGLHLLLKPFPGSNKNRNME